MKSWILLFFSFLAIPTIAQVDGISITGLEKAVVIDGSIDEQWSRCAPVTLTHQLEPDFGMHPTRETEVRAAQYRDSLYFLFVCHVNDPGEIVARIQRRDQLNLNDDVVSLVLDTYHDRHNAVLFQVNPLGTIADAKITGDGKKIDYLWDTEWEARTGNYDDSWVVEIAIPLASIQYDPSSTQWGCNFSRSIRSNLEIAWWKSVTENYRVSQGGVINGLDYTEKRLHRLTLFPYATGRYENSDITGNYNSIKGDAGMDIRYSYGSNLNANLAVNPDFATVEGDKEQINLTPWELKFPEKRLFFQDGNEMFDTRIQTFYSRRIGDMLFGGKANGKVGKYQFNGLYGYTQEDSKEGIPPAQFTSLRVKRDFLESSTLGMTYTDKITDTAVFHTFSADYKLNLGKTWKLTGQFVGSLPGDFLSHSAWFVRFARENNTYHYHIRYTELGENFRDNVNETGFITDDDRREMDSDVNYKFWFDNVFSYIKLSGKNNIYWSRSSGVLRSWYLTWGGRVYMKNRLSLDLYYNNEFKNSYRGVHDDYNNHFYRGILGFNTDENNFAELSYRRGVNFHRDFNLLELNTNIQFLKRFSASYELRYIDFDPDPTDQSTVLNILGLSYYQTKDLWLRIFAQHSTRNDRIYLYAQAGWRFKPPFGALYLIYSSDDYTDLLLQEQMASKILFIKLTYPITIL